ncbi:MAG TPA: hypothetical protein DF613_16340, partial [Lachnospiraceae bacterium]|nr:hypothetical protein [Lachnospiraceae bacterium]
MKKWKKLLVGLLAMALSLSCIPDCGFTVNATGTAPGDPLSDFTWSIANDEITIERYKGNEKKKVEFPAQESSKIISIGDGAFQYFDKITEIKLPDAVKNIGKAAFSGCSSLTKINIPAGVTTIENETFSGCSSLTEIKIPNGVTTIGNEAFSGCSNLTKINIPESVTSIGYGAFSDCSSLTEITIPARVTKIGSTAFSGCRGLTEITVAEGNTKYESKNCNAIIDRQNNTLIAGCQNTTIPDNITTIKGGAFSGCSGL